MRSALLLLALVLLPAVLNRFGRFFAAEIFTWALYAMGFNICFGMAGMLSFGHAAFFASGAYGATWTILHVVRDPWLALAAAVVAATALATLVGFFAVRVVSHSFVIITITFSLVLPSALSLYSLAFTIYRSRFRWTPASTALFLGLVGWLLAGLSGVVNATIAFDVIVHNTLWIVGHFHHMAMLNIGLLIFGAVYALLPELTGKALYSERMAWVHVWTTFLAGMTVFGIWLVQGLDGAPRRWSVLPGQYDTLTRVSLPFVLLLAAVQILFFWNVLQTVRGKAGAAAFDERGIPVPGPRREWSGHAAEAGIVLIALFIAFAFAVAGYVVGRETAEGDTTPVTTATTTEPAGPDLAAGKELFVSSACGGCHLLADAGGAGTVGPSLDGNAALTEAVVVDRVTNGKGAMPSFSDRLTPEEIEDVAAYVMSAKGL